MSEREQKTTMTPEQSPDTALIAALCESVRLAREYRNAMAGRSV